MGCVDHWAVLAPRTIFALAITNLDNTRYRARLQVEVILTPHLPMLPCLCYIVRVRLLTGGYYAELQRIRYEFGESFPA